MRTVLKKDSSEPLLEGLNPTPEFEVEFWKAKALNLECIYDQVNISLSTEFLCKCKLCSCVIWDDRNVCE